MARSEGGMMDRRDLFLALAGELRGLSASAASLQATLGDILDDVAGLGQAEQGIWHMQEIDRLQQTLDDLAAILKRAAEHDGHVFEVENLLTATRLGALRERLRGNGRDAAASDQSGVVALF